jgi:lipid-A-disaccharide synthase
MAVGEASGDALGAQLLASLHARRPELTASGVAGRRMQAQGALSYVPFDKLAQRVPGRARGRKGELARIGAGLVAHWLADPPALFIGIGLPEFNLPIARRLKAAGIRALQYMGPEVWAWRRWQVKRVARYVDCVLTQFPFETAIYEQAGVPARFVGHALADQVPLEVDKAAARTQLRLPHGRRIVALLPGEHASAPVQLTEIFVKAARRLFNEVGDVHFVMPASSRESREWIETALRLHADGDFPLTALFGHAHEALAAAELALVSSGIASLEAALFKTPMVIVHRTTAADWWLARSAASRRIIGLPNLLIGEHVVPEYVQQRATPWDLAAALAALLADASGRAHQVERFQEIHRALRQDAAHAACEVVLGMLDHDGA